MQTYRTNKGRVVTKVFEEVFDKYDLMNDLMSLGIHRLWKKTFINWLNPQVNTRLIDVASGTGDIAKLFLDKVDYESNVCCVDENKDMLKISRKKLNDTTNVKWYCNSAEKLPFKNDEFDYYTSTGMILDLLRSVDRSLTRWVAFYTYHFPGCVFAIYI